MRIQIDIDIADIQHPEGSPSAMLAKAMSDDRLPDAVTEATRSAIREVIERKSPMTKGIYCTARKEIRYAVSLMPSNIRFPSTERAADAKS